MARRYESTLTRDFPRFDPRGDRECRLTPTALPAPALRRRLARPRVAIRPPLVVRAVLERSQNAVENAYGSQIGCRAIRSQGYPISRLRWRASRHTRHPQRPPQSLPPMRQAHTSDDGRTFTLRGFIEGRSVAGVWGSTWLARQRAVLHIGSVIVFARHF